MVEIFCDYPDKKYDLEVDPPDKFIYELNIVRNPRESGKPDSTQLCVIPSMVRGGVQVCPKCNSTVTTLIARYPQSK